MTTVTAAPAERSPGLLLSWLGGTDHKRIAAHLGWSCGVFLVIGGLAALAMRTELAQPGLQFLSRDHYNELYSLHGSTMIYFVMTPAALALGAYLVPLQIGAADLVAPRLNLFALWLLVAGGGDRRVLLASDRVRLPARRLDRVPADGERHLLARDRDRSVAGRRGRSRARDDPDGRARCSPRSCCGARRA